MIQVPLSSIDRLSFFEQAMHWCVQHFTFVACLDGHDLSYPFGSFPTAIHVGNQALSLEQVSSKEHMLVGILSYDYKNSLEKLRSENSLLVQVPDTCFFEAVISMWVEGEQLFIQAPNAVEVFQQIQEVELPRQANAVVAVQAITSKEVYMANVRAIQQHIEEGDVYELNYCLAYTFESINWSPLQAFRDLKQLSPMPFSVFFKAEDRFLIGASPERFLKKTGNALLAQPIKGTVRRGVNPEEDAALARQLKASEKERAENLMIVDLMRNDLSKVSEVGSVTVEELFGVYAFPRVHQMISTVSSRIKEESSIQDIFKATFPMGSMTGAPKIKCMELIERYEDFRRGWYSGSVGFIHPSGDFDFNVIIRSIIYDADQGKGYFAVGSAITYDADPATEFEECQLKASAIRQVLEGRWSMVDGQ